MKTTRQQGSEERSGRQRVEDDGGRRRESGEKPEGLGEPGNACSELIARKGTRERMKGSVVLDQKNERERERKLR